MHIAQAIKQASIKQLLALTLTDYWEQTECAAQSEWRQLSVWSRRMHPQGSRWLDVLFISFFFWRSLRNLHFSWRQTCRIGQASQLLQLPNARGRSRKPFEERRTSAAAPVWAKKTLKIAARPRSWNPRGRSVARPAGLGCRRRLAKAGHVKKKRPKEKCKTDKNKAKEKSKLTWVWHKSGLAFDSCVRGRQSRGVLPTK